MTVEGRLDDASLHSASTTMYQPHFFEPGDGGGVHIFFDDRRNIAWRERVQVDLGFDGNVMHDRYDMAVHVMSNKASPCSPFSLP